MFLASFILSSARKTGRTSPVKPISPKHAKLFESGKFRIEEIIEKQTARS